MYPVLNPNIYNRLYYSGIQPTVMNKIEIQFVVVDELEYEQFDDKIISVLSRSFVVLQNSQHFRYRSSCAKIDIPICWIDWAENHTANNHNQCFCCQPQSHFI